MVDETPLMRQYTEIKKDYQDSILFFRLGDFYEMFYEDAKIASKELGLTLTKRNKKMDVPLAGIPYHSASSYIAKLVNKGYKVAICEQVEDPKEVKGIVKREVIRVITPGTIIDTDYLDEKNNNYLMGILIKDKSIGISYVDITTGEFKTSKLEGKNLLYKLLGEINKVYPKEILIDEKSLNFLQGELQSNRILEKINITKVQTMRNPEKYLLEYFEIQSLDSFGIKNNDDIISVCAMVLKYVVDLQKGNELPIRKISYVSTEKIMELNLTTQRNLDIVENYNRNDSGTLLGVLDFCKNSMGSRYLKRILKNPTLDIDEIHRRQNDIEYFINEVLVREEVREKLKDIYDIERIIGKLTLETVNGRDLVALKESIKNILEIYKVLIKNNSNILDLDVEKLIDVYNLIDKVIIDEPPFSIREGGIIKPGYNEELDELRNIAEHGQDYLLKIETEEREKTGIKGLKIKYNKVFGYFIEITKANIDLVPDYYIRKQTLVNAERYIVPELKEYEDKILNAKNRISTLEYYLFKEIVGEIKNYIEMLQELSNKIAYLDVISNFAYIAIKNNYVKPEIVQEGEIEILGGRHPIVEKLIPAGEFVKNKVLLNENKDFIILTGPNMSGKSTYMKQIALIIIMAHIGSYVPADYAKISLVDKIFTRIGASDDLITGQSTFMLEMSEVANILNSATNRSFIILDEIGRGTSTFDGISIASAITEYIHDNIKAKTIFATHYHELTELGERLKRAANFRIEVQEKDNKIKFLREIVQGGADKSYGIEVARLAGLPKEILVNSKKILNILEERKDIIEQNFGVEQMMLFGNTPTLEIKKEEKKEKVETISEEEKRALSILREIDINNFTPMEALLKINELKKILN
ncbi:DNA mismatch repair protein MutS [Fusobacterium sp.]|uniref:DNA mismatch repair protein MutS n=1 Tax=Fusobacterium sp. TaxID=68766 RepID=UPI00260999B1|nr:DNA mismatch repair protein MutS [Fusobacterium sp.]